MGIRFACHSCGKPLNIKNSLAGKRAKCPQCQTSLRIPIADADHSTPMESPPTSVSTIKPAATANSPSQPVASAPPPSSLQTTPSSLAMMDDDQTATWYLRPPAGGKYGPADRQTLQQWIDEGRVASTALLWREGWAQWRTAAEALPDLAEKLAQVQPLSTAANNHPQKNEAAPGQQIVQQSGRPHPADFIVDPIADPAPGFAANPMAKPLAGDAKIGTARAGATQRRLFTVAILTATLFALLAILALLVWR